MNKSLRNALTLSLAVALGAAACGDDGGGSGQRLDTGADVGIDVGADSGVDADDGGLGGDADSGSTDSGSTNNGGIVALTEPLTLASNTGCFIDGDCSPGLFCFQGGCASECVSDSSCGAGETCSDRGRCLAPNSNKSLDESEEAAVADQIPSVSVTTPIPPVIEIDAGQTQIVLTLETDDAVPGGTVLYRSELAGFERPLELLRAKGSRSFDFIIPTGVADPASDDPGPQRVSLETSIGAFVFDLVPRWPFAGTYGGEVVMETFGNVGLPLELQLVVEPEGASLAAATSAWVVLPVEGHRIFSPHERFDDATTFVTRPLVYDGFIDRWVAIFNHEYRLGDDAVFAQAPPGQIQRIMRIELEPAEDRRVVGRISDRWTGFYDSRSADGVVSLEDVVFQGTFDLRRYAGALSVAEATPPVELPAPSPDVQPLPPLDACSDDDLAIAPLDVEGVEESCDGIATLGEFELAAPAARVSCAIAVAETALAGETTADQIIAFLDDSIENPGGMSFAEFMQKCALGEDNICVPSPEVLCGRQLLAYAYASQEEELSQTAQLVASYQTATREAFLGRQLAAFQTDSELRLTWLQTTDYPAIVTSAVQDLNEQLLREWRENVLDVHMAVLRGQFDASGLAVLSRSPTGEAARAARVQLLLEMQQTWRAAMEALTLASQRWHTLYQGDADRAEAARFVQTRMFDLYLLAGIQAQLNRDAGSGFANAAFGSGFAALMRELEQLTLPFTDLIYARDGEVVVSTSLDPTEGNDTLLSGLESLAIEAIGDAEDSVTTVIAEADQDAIDAATIRNRMTNQITVLRDQLIELCGLPVGCSAADVGVDPECDVRTEGGYCGFVTNRDGEYELNIEQTRTTSEAGSRVFDYYEAIQEYNIAFEEYRAHTSRTALAYATTEAFALRVADWDTRRRAVSAQTTALLSNIRALENEELNEALAAIEAEQELREEAYDRQADSVARWASIRIDGVEQDIGRLIAVTSLRRTAEATRETAASIDTMGSITADGLPKAVTDATFTARFAVNMAAYGISSGMRFWAQAADTVADGLEVAGQQRAAVRDAVLTELQDLSELDALRTETDIAEIQSNLLALSLQTEAETTAIQDLINTLEATLALDLAHERDLVELEDRRAEVTTLADQAFALEARVLQAELTVAQALLEYYRTVQSAQLAAGRLDDLRSQLANLNQLLGSPATVFAWANRLTQAENRLERAKDALMEWLVALEYYAVRPFMDQRLQILLARNTYQLEDIADELRRLQRSCGGAVNTNTTELSLRDDLLDIGFDGIDSIDGATYTAAERFRAVLQRGAVPIDKRTRYTADDTIGDLLNRREVWAATFSLNLNDFANLAATCNAKIASISVQLVGEGLGSAIPTVSILYDGASQLRSCQPGLQAYVDQFGPDATVFGPVTAFRTAGRSIAPIAGINEFPNPNNGNTTLSGLPLASQYTVLIDPDLGENGDINWEALEDIRLRVVFVSQDPFPAGQCE